MQTLGAVGQQSQQAWPSGGALLGLAGACIAPASLQVGAWTHSSQLPAVFGYVSTIHSNCLPRRLHLIILASACRSATTVLGCVIERHGDSCTGFVMQRALSGTMVGHQGSVAIQTLHALTPLQWLSQCDACQADSIAELTCSLPYTSYAASAMVRLSSWVPVVCEAELQCCGAMNLVAAGYLHRSLQVRCPRMPTANCKQALLILCMHVHSLMQTIGSASALAGNSQLIRPSTST